MITSLVSVWQIDSTPFPILERFSFVCCGMRVNKRPVLLP